VLAAIALAYFTKEQHFSLYTSWQMIAAIFIFILAFAGFLGAILGWPFPPWAKLGFPNIKVNIYGAGDAHTEREVASDFRVLAYLWRYKARITNLEKEQNASLTVRLYLKLVPGSYGRVGEIIGTSVDWAIDPSLGLDPLPETLSLPPGTTISGDLVYEISRMYSGTIAEPRQARLEIEDHISGKRMEKVLEGDLARFTRADMRATRGGFAILGPEYDVEPTDVDDGDGQAIMPPEQSDPGPSSQAVAQAGTGVTVPNPGTAGSAATQLPSYRRFWRWAMSDHPEAVAVLISVVVALVSVIVAVRALNAQTSSDRMTSDLQTRAFASQVSLWGETSAPSGPQASFPQTLHIDNRNNAPLGVAWLIVGVRDNVQFTDDGFAVTNQLTWRKAYALGRQAPCSTLTLDYASFAPPGGKDVSLFFIDDNDLGWYRNTDGLLVQAELHGSVLKRTLDALYSPKVPYFPKTVGDFSLLSGCA